MKREPDWALIAIVFCILTMGAALLIMGAEMEALKQGR